MAGPAVCLVEWIVAGLLVAVLGTSLVLSVDSWLVVPVGLAAG